MPPDQDNRPGKQDSHQKQKRPSSFLVLSPKADASFGRIGVASQWKNHMAATSKPVALPSANDSINDV